MALKKYEVSPSFLATVVIFCQQWEMSLFITSLHYGASLFLSSRGPVFLYDQEVALVLFVLLFLLFVQW